MLIQVDFYKETGKWYAGGRMEVDAKAYDTQGVMRNIRDGQKFLVPGVFDPPVEFYVVVSDIPESMADPNYRMTYSRLYTPDQIETMTQ